MHLVVSVVLPLILLSVRVAVIVGTAVGLSVNVVRLSLGLISLPVWRSSARVLAIVGWIVALLETVACRVMLCLWNVPASVNVIVFALVGVSMFARVSASVSAMRLLGSVSAPV